jgi:NADH dehydrogenase/putative oxidoreductase
MTDAAPPPSAPAAGERRARLAAVVDACRAGLRLAAPVIDLLVRLSLARAFFAPDMLPNLPLLDALRTEWAALAVQIGGPALLAVGFLIRPVALVMLALTLLAQAAVPHDEHLFWAALFGWYVLQGAGPLSLDHLLGKGLGLSPLPFAARGTAAADWVNRRIGPLYRLALRLWLAAAIVGAALAPAMLPGMQAGMLPRPAALLAAACLALGFGTPLVAAVLLLAASGAAVMGHDQGFTLYGPLLLALIGVSGAGRYALDHLIVGLLHRETPLPPDAPHIVIVGAGFGGMACAEGLRHERARITLIDRHNYNLFQPLLYQVATGGLSPADIATPIRHVFRDAPHLTVLCAAVASIDTSARNVLLDDGQSLAYDVLVLATGAGHGYFGHEEWAAHAPGLKSLHDATAIRSRILDAFERAEAADDPAARAALLTFLVCGAGPTGVELAGAIAELSRNGMDKDFRNFDPASARILLVQAGPRVLPAFDERLSAFAQASLEALGVQVRVNSRVEAIDAGGVMVNGERIAAATVLWAAGVVASPAAAWLGVRPDRAGRVPVGADLSVPGLPDVFAIGDTALSHAWAGEPVPGLAPAAKQGGAHVARVLRARLRGGAKPPPFRYRHQGSLATIGRKSAIADFGWIKLTGALAWWLWGAVHILFLLNMRNRLAVMLGWAWSYFTFDVGVRLITEDRPPDGRAPDGPASRLTPAAGR